MKLAEEKQSCWKARGANLALQCPVYANGQWNCEKQLEGVKTIAAATFEFQNSISRARHLAQIRRKKREVFSFNLNSGIYAEIDFKKEIPARKSTLSCCLNWACFAGFCLSWHLNKCHRFVPPKWPPSFQFQFCSIGKSAPYLNNFPIAVERLKSGRFRPFVPFVQDITPKSE